MMLVALAIRARLNKPGQITQANIGGPLESCVRCSQT